MKRETGAGQERENDQVDTTKYKIKNDKSNDPTLDLGPPFGVLDNDSEGRVNQHDTYLAMKEKEREGGGKSVFLFLWDKLKGKHTNNCIVTMVSVRPILPMSILAVRTPFEAALTRAPSS
jgi:hypothetical protein